MSRYPAGTVVIYQGPAGRALATVAMGPLEDGTYNLDCATRVERNRLSEVPAGQPVEYNSASLKQWIAARVLRPGQVAGTLDLDCKEGVDVNRVRLAEATPGTVSAGLSNQAAAGTGGFGPSAALPSQGYGAVPQGFGASMPSNMASPASAPSNMAPPKPPQVLNPGEICFYKSSTHGWIPAKVMRCRPEDGLFDLNVKQQVHRDSIYRLGDGDAVEYDSASAGRWIPARIVRQGSDAESFDLDCKIGVHITKLRPLLDASAMKATAPTYCGASPSSPGPMAFGGLAASGKGYVEPMADTASMKATAPTYCGASQGSAAAGKDRLDFRPASTSAKLTQLKQAVEAEDATVIRQRLGSESALKLVGEDLDEAAHLLWQLEARPAAQEELNKACRARNARAIEAALEAAAVAGVPEADLQRAADVLKSLQVTKLWRYDAGDGKHLDIRETAQIDGPRTRNRLNSGDVFYASEQVKGADGILYLKLSDDRGWVFERKPGVGVMCKPYQQKEEDGPGVYIVIHDQAAVTPTVALGQKDDVVAKISAGTTIEVLFVEHRVEMGRVRARLREPPGWLSLLDYESGKRWAVRR